ncbi:unnamed protein product [Heterobilharzia americana]|nr:unnamed protein product [Heterobilharzia americana]
MTSLPSIDAIVAKVLSRNGINWIRVPVERVPEESSQLNEAEINFYKEVSDQATEAKKTFTSYNLKFTQGFIGMTIMGKNQTIQSLDQCLSSLENYESIEFMVHPGFKISHSSDLDTAGCGNPEGPDLFSQSNDREHEMAFLTSDEFRKYLLAIVMNL